MAQTRPFFVSDKVLKTALIGLDKKALELEALPPALQKALQAISAQGLEPVDAFFKVANLVFAYEGSSENSLVDCFTSEEMEQIQVALANAGGDCSVTTEKADSTEEADKALADLLLRYKQHQGPVPLIACGDHGSAEHYIPANLMQELVSPKVTLTTFVAILSRLRHLNFKVPPLYLVSFIQVYMTFLKELSSNLKNMPLEFLSANTHFLLPYLSANASDSGPSDSGPVAGKYSLAEKSALDSSGAGSETESGSAESKTPDDCPELLYKWTHNSIAGLQELFKTIVRRHELGLLLSLLPPVDRFFRGKYWDGGTWALILMDLYWGSLLTYFYQNGQYPVAAHTALSFSSASMGGSVDTGESTEASADASPEQSEPVHSRSNSAKSAEQTAPTEPKLRSQLESWLIQLLKIHNPSRMEKQKTATLLCLLPGSSFEQELVAYAYSVPQPNWAPESSKLIFINSQSHQQQQQQPSFTQTLQWCLDRMQSDLGTMLRPAKNGMELLIFLLPPALWFEIFEIERTGDDTRDADTLLRAFTQYYEHYESEISQLNTDFVAKGLLSFKIRLRFELGATYLAAFYRYFWSILSGKQILDLIAEASYSEREFMLQDSSPDQKAPVLFLSNSWCSNPLTWSNSLCKELPQRWGPKFSQLYVAVLMDWFSDWSLIRDRSACTKHEDNNISLLSFSLDLQVMAQAKQCLEKRLATLKTNIVQLEAKMQTLQDAKAREDITLRKNYEYKLNCSEQAKKILEQLLVAFADALQIEQWCEEAKASAKAR